MAPFSYRPFEDRFSGTIADIMLRRGDVQASGALRRGQIESDSERQRGDIAARHEENRGQIVAGAINSIGHAVSGAVNEMGDPRRKADEIRLRQAQQQEAGQQRLDQLMTPYTPNGPMQDGETRTPQTPYLDERGLYKISELSKALAESGMAHLAPDLLKSAESINASTLGHMDLERKLGEHATQLYGDMAAGTLKLWKAGMPFDQALGLATAPGVATARFDPQQFGKLRDTLTSMPPEQQEAALTSLMDAAAKLGGETNITDGTDRIDRYGRVIAQNIKTPPMKPQPTRASLAADAQDPKSPTRLQSIEALKEWDKAPPAPKSLQSENEWRVDGKSRPVIFDPASGARYLSEADIAAKKPIDPSRLQKIPPASQMDKKVDQNKLEQEYRTVLARGLSSRSGGLGLEDSKVQQANHLLALMDQNFNPKTGEYDIPKVMLGELALGLARLTSPGGQVGVQLMEELNQKTAKGDVAGVLTYLTGKPFSGSTQAVFKMFRDSIQRQGEVALENREGEMRYLRGLAPTELDEKRRQQMERTTLNPLRQSRVIRNTKTGEVRMQTSTDGGETWK